MMPHSINTAVLARYFDDAASREECAAVNEWVGVDPARLAALEEWRVAWRADRELLGSAYDPEAAWARLSERVGLLTVVRDVRPMRSVRLAPSVRSRPGPAAAVRWVAAAVVVIAGAAVLRTGGWWNAGHGAKPPAGRDYVMPRAQRGIVRLPDGTEIMLNVASRLTVPATFGRAGQARAVELEGQAYFTVVHDATRPFIVRTPRGVTRDVGTRFDVRAYPGDAEERIMVAEGEVAVHADSAAGEVPVREAQAAVIGSSGRVTVVSGVTADDDLAWTRGRLQLDGVTLAEAARRLSRWYDLDVRVADRDLAERRVVGSYGNEPVSQVLGIIGAAVGARYEQHERSITFIPADGSR